jgi:hypothetical protein
VRKENQYQGSASNRTERFPSVLQPVPGGFQSEL